MPWGWFAIGLLVAYVAQVGLSSLHPLLVLALVCGLTAPVQEARIAGWIVGLGRDISDSSPSPMGLHAFAMGLMVLLLTQVRGLVNRELWWVRWLVAFVAAFPAQLLVLLHDRFLPPQANLTWLQILGDSFLTAAVAGLLAALLVRLPAALRRRPRRYAVPRRW